MVWYTVCIQYLWTTCRIFPSMICYPSMFYYLLLYLLYPMHSKLYYVVAYSIIETWKRRFEEGTWDAIDLHGKNETSIVWPGIEVVFFIFTFSTCQVSEWSWWSARTVSGLPLPLPTMLGAPKVTSTMLFEKSGTWKACVRSPSPVISYSNRGKQNSAYHV